MLELTDASCLLKLSFGIDRIFVGGKSRRGAGGARGDRALSQDFHSTFNEVFCKISLLLNQLNDIQFSDRADQVKNPPQSRWKEDVLAKAITEFLDAMIWGQTTIVKAFMSKSSPSWGGGSKRGYDDERQCKWHFRNIRQSLLLMAALLLLLPAKSRKFYFHQHLPHPNCVNKSRSGRKRIFIFPLWFARYFWRAQ